ncbi:MAG: hypothetical protein ABIF18_02770 [archaeon]
MVKILSLGNEFIAEDSFAKKISDSLPDDFDIINIKDSFQLMEILNEVENPIILDVVKGLEKVRLISIDDLRNDSILSAHDFDAGYVLKLIGKECKIIGIPPEGNFDEIRKEVLEILKAN